MNKYEEVLTKFISQSEKTFRLLKESMSINNILLESNRRLILENNNLRSKLSEYSEVKLVQ